MIASMVSEVTTVNLSNAEQSTEMAPVGPSDSSGASSDSVKPLDSAEVPPIIIWSQLDGIVDRIEVWPNSNKRPATEHDTC